MKQDRKFQGVWIPADLWLADGLSITEKCLLVEINSLDNDEERGCFASNEYLGKFLGLSAGRVANMISDLKKRKYIIQVYFDGRNRGLRLHENVKNLHENVKAALTESLKLPSRKREHSNIDNNNSIEGENAPAQFIVKTIALETIPTVEGEVPRPDVDWLPTADMINEPDWMQVAKDMEAYAKGEGAAQWRFMCEAQGYKGEVLPIVSNWASKASKYQLMNWKSEFRKLQTWLKTESRADYKAAQRNGTPAPATSAPITIRREI